MDSYIKARLERAERFLNDALAYSKGTIKPPKGINCSTTEQMVKACLGASLEQLKAIEKYIHQCGTQAKEDKQYHQIIE